MKKGSLKKYILPNMPYVFMAWACLKLGTAYRLAAGANAGEKLVGMMNTINTAFASPRPWAGPGGLAGRDRGGGGHPAVRLRQGQKREKIPP